MWPFRPTSDPLHGISSFSVTPKLQVKHLSSVFVVRKMPTRRNFVWSVVVWGKKCIQKSFRGNTAGGDRALIRGATVDLVWYLGPHAPVFQMIEKLELMYGAVTSFDILRPNSYKLQQIKKERVPVFVIQSERALNMVEWEHPHMLSTGEVQKHLRGWLFHGLQNLLWDLMRYLYDDPRIMFPQLMTEAHNALSTLLA